MRTDHFHPGVHRFAVFTACCTFGLLIAGGLVTSTDSGLAVPDWPLSYGQFMPPMVGGIFYEHGHRMIATFVGILTVILAIALWRVEKRRWVRVLGFLSLGAVVTQGVLGGLTVLFLLPTPVSVAHAMLAQSFFSLTILLALVTSAAWMQPSAGVSAMARATRWFAVSAVFVVLLQLFLGAWMRHSSAGLAIPDFPLTYGTLLPPMDEGGLAAVNQIRMAWYDMPPVSIGQIWIHFLHRGGALVAACVVLGFGRHILRSYPGESRLREPAIVMMMLILVQLLLGALTVWTGKGVQIATAHVAVGALLLATSVFVAARVFRFFVLPAPARPPVRALAAEAGAQ